MVIKLFYQFEDLDFLKKHQKKKAREHHSPGHCDKKDRSKHCDKKDGQVLGQKKLHVPEIF